MANTAKDIFEAKSESASELLSETGKGFYIPAYQRGYDWDSQKVGKLWTDLLSGFRQLVKDNTSFTFLGSIILMQDRDFVTIEPIVRPEVPSKVLNVIDGQQRLTTLLALAVALHSEAAFHVSGLVGTDPEFTWLRDKVAEAQTYLEDCIYFDKIRGRRKYPRIVRAYADEWSYTKPPKYESPVARLAFQYHEFQSAHAANPASSPGRFVPTWDDDLVKRYKELQKLVRNVENPPTDEDPNVLGKDVVDAVCLSTTMQKELLDQECDPAVRNMAGSGTNPTFRSLLLVLLLSNYLLKRIALTTVVGRSEDYAFEVFESLNTTGEPLTAYQTFVPRVVRAETLAGFQSSQAKKELDKVEAYLNRFSVGRKKQKATSDLLTAFALAEDGTRLEGRLPLQRKYLQPRFESISASPTARTSFLGQLAYVAEVFAYGWQNSATPALPGISLTPEAQFAIGALHSMTHSIVVAPLARAYSTAKEDRAREADVSSLVKAMLAFTILWRSSAPKAGTDNVDAEYRSIMRGDPNNVPGLSRAAGPTIPPIDAIKAELRSRLAARCTYQQWLTRASTVEIYHQNLMAQLMLLIAENDAAPDRDTPGLTVRGRPSSNRQLTLDGLLAAQRLSIEHVAPRAPSLSWDGAIYSNGQLNTLGNLVLVPGATNSVLNNRGWEQKSWILAALACRTAKEAEDVLQESGIRFSSQAEKQLIADHVEWWPQLEALGIRGRKHLSWDSSFVEMRTQRILELVWKRLHDEWLS